MFYDPDCERSNNYLFEITVGFVLNKLDYITRPTVTSHQARAWCNGQKYLYKSHCNAQCIADFRISDWYLSSHFAISRRATMGERLLLVLVVHTRFGALFGSKFKYTNENIEWLNSDWIPTEYSESIEFWLIWIRLNSDWRLNKTNRFIDCLIDYWLFDWMFYDPDCERSKNQSECNRSIQQSIRM